MPRQMAAAVERLLGHLDGQLGRIAEALRLAVGPALFGDLVELGLRPLDLLERRHVLTGVERALHQVAPDTDERPKQGQIVDLLGEVLARR